MIRKADPYRDTDVIDARAPRTNQAIVGTLSLLAAITGWWPIFGLLAGQLAIGLVFGRRYCVPCLLYFEVIQPRIGEGPIEDSRPPRFANVVGAVFLGAATVAYLVGQSTVGLLLGLLVAALALVAATTGLCVGCEIYRIAARLRAFAPVTSTPSTSPSSARPARAARSSSSSRIRSARTVVLSKPSYERRGARS
jgi:hypothetical protein